MIPHYKNKSLIVFLAIIAVISIIVCCNNHPKTKEEAITAHEYLNLNDTAKYVGINTCKQCHQDIYNTFIKTGMGKSFDHATREKTSAKFDAHSLIYDKYSDYYYIPFWDRDSLHIMEFRLNGKDTVHKRIETVSYIIGSGQHTNSHIMNRDGYLYQMPMTFYTQKGLWDFPPGFENGNNTRFSRQIGLECMSCHNALPDYVHGSENKYNLVPEGINCERCHGPGEAHVKDKQAGHIVDTVREIDYSIVNPAKLPINLQFDECQRCHLQGNAVLNDGKSFFDFRPGMKLSDVMNVFMPVFKGREDEFIMASHAERLKMSKCFMNTTGKIESGEIKVSNTLNPYKDALTCVTCHNPHVSVKVTGKEVFNAACINCHSSSKTNHPVICSEKEDVRKMKNDNCVGCHMPRSGTIDIPHVTSTDHFIRKPVAAKELSAIKEWIGIKCINNPNPSNKTIAKAYLNYYEKFSKTPAALDSAKKYLPETTNEDVHQNFSSLIRYYYIKEDFNNIISLVNKFNSINNQATLNSLNKKSLDNDDAWTSYRIGEAFRNVSDAKSAYQYFDNAVNLSPYNLDFCNKKGAMAMQLNQIADAKKIFTDILHEDPEYVAALNNLGFIYLAAEHNNDKAKELYDKALALDPDYEQALLNKAGWYAYNNQLNNAKELLHHLLKKHPDNKEAKAALIKLGN